MSILIIAEKPSVVQTIASALGVKNKKDGYMEKNRFLVSWCVRHLVQLAEAAVYGDQYRKWSYDSLPILPQEWQYTVSADKVKQFKILKELMHRNDVSEVVNACDAGREEELIFHFVYEVARCKKPMQHLWISSMKESVLKVGFASLKDGREYENLYSSALCRTKADWIIDINATCLFSCMYGKTLNVGCVQTPTLKMFVDRDVAITTFLLSAMERVGNEETDPINRAPTKSKDFVGKGGATKYNEYPALDRCSETKFATTQHKGLVTPATRTSVIEKLVKGGFVECKGKQLLPIRSGNELICVLSDVLTSPQLTADWENNLTQIAKGNADPDAFMGVIKAMARELIKTYPFFSDKEKERSKEEKNAPAAALPSTKERKTTIAATGNVPLSCGRTIAFLRNAK